MNCDKAHLHRLFNRSEAKWRLGQSEKALEDLDLIESRGGDDSTNMVNMMVGEAILKRGELLIKLGRINDAIECANRLEIGLGDGLL